MKILGYVPIGSEPFISSTLQDRISEGKKVLVRKWWSVSNTHIGWVKEDFYKDIEIFQSLFSKDKQDYYRELTKSLCLITPMNDEEKLERAKIFYKEDLEKWHLLKEKSNGIFGYNTVAEFLAFNYKGDYIRMASSCGNNDPLQKYCYRLQRYTFLQLLEREIRILRLKAICLYKNSRDVK